jgi:hypothetical protein
VSLVESTCDGRCGGRERQRVWLRDSGKMHLVCIACGHLCVASLLTMQCIFGNINVPGVGCSMIDRSTLDNVCSNPIMPGQERVGYGQRHHGWSMQSWLRQGCVWPKVQTGEVAPCKCFIQFTG